MTIATASTKGKPWISPVYFAYDAGLNLYWSSAKSSLHSRLISKNSDVAVVIFNSSAAEGAGDGVYMAGKAYEARGNEIAHALHLLSYRTGKPSKYFAGKTPKDYQGKSPVRIYKIPEFHSLTLAPIFRIRTTTPIIKEKQENKHEKRNLHRVRQGGDDKKQLPRDRGGVLLHPCADQKDACGNAGCRIIKDRVIEKQALCKGADIMESRPKCCGAAMKVNAETPSFFELMCRICGDIVYAKKGNAAKPQMIDD